jgi:mono/diheme cytochrome c family protein
MARCRNYVRRTAAGALWLGLCLTAGCTDQPHVFEFAAEPGDSVQERFGRGKTIAQHLCAGCHAIGPKGTSPHPDAVPLRQLSWRYPVRSLREPLSTGIVVGHPDMPEWQFESQDVDALLTYIESIQQTQPT